MTTRDQKVFKYYKSDNEYDMLIPEGVFNMDYFEIMLSTAD